MKLMIINVQSLIVRPRQRKLVLCRAIVMFEEVETLKRVMNDVVYDARTTRFAERALEICVSFQRRMSRYHLRPLKDAMEAEGMKARIQKSFA